MNPIKTSDLFINSGELDKIIKDLERINGLTEELRQTESKKAKQLEQTIKTTGTATRQQRDELEANAKQVAEIERRYNKYTESLNDNALKIAALRSAQTEINRLNKLEAKLISSKEGSYNRLSAQLSINKIRLKQLTEAEQKYTKEGKELVKQTNEINNALKRMDKSVGVNTRNVGNYQSAFEGLTGPLKTVSERIKGVGKQAKILLRNPIVLFLAAITAAAVGLFNAFKKSEKGAQFFAQAGAYLNGVMSELTEISVSVAEGLTEAFENPQEAIKSFGNLILDNVLNRFKSIPLLAQAAGKAFKAALSGDFEEVREAGKDALFAINQAITGLNEEQAKNFAEAIGEVAKNTKETGGAFLELDKNQKRVIKSNRALSKSIEQLRTEEELSQLIADDTTKSFKEREEAQEAAQQATKKRTSLEIQLAKNSLSVINQEIALRRANGELVTGLLDEQLLAYKKLIAAERNYSLSVERNERTRAQLKQDRLERDLDILIDAFENQKKVNERLLKDDQISFEKRAEIYQKTGALADESFLKQIETVQKFTGVQVDANDLINESNAVVLNEKIRALGLSEIIEGRLLEIIRERRLAVQDLAEAEIDLLAARKKATADALNLKVEEYFGIEALDDFDTKGTEQKIQKLARFYFVTARSAIESEKNKQQPQSIYDFLGIDLSKEQEDAANTAFQSAKNNLTELANLQAQLAAQSVQRSNQQINEAQRALDLEIQNRNAGFAHQVQTRQKELADAKKQQQKALREQEKAQRAQLAIQTIQQTSNLITASSKIFSQVGNPVIAIPLIALMWGTFIAAKVRAAQLTKQQYAEGGYEIVGGGTHASGNDTYLGFQVGGKPAYAERDEGHAIFTPRMTKKYRSVIPDLVKSINKGNFEKRYTEIGKYGFDQGTLHMNNFQVNNDNRGVERRLDTMIKQNEEARYFTNGAGQLVRKYKNITTTYVG